MSDRSNSEKENQTAANNLQAVRDISIGDIPYNVILGYVNYSTAIDIYSYMGQN